MTSKIDKKIERGDVYWVNLDPTIGSEIQKTRPAVIISNNIQNKVSSRVVIIPVTSSTDKFYPFEAGIHLKGKSAKALTDQIRSVDKSRLTEIICRLNKTEILDIEKAIKLTLSLD